MARLTSKISGHTSITFFYIWLAQNTRTWEVGHVCFPTEPSPINQASCQDSQQFSGTSQNIIWKEASISAASKHVGFFNKGNTSYANSTLQAFSVLPSFYSQESSMHDKMLPLSRAVNTNMYLLKHKTSPNNPPSFLWAFKKQDHQRLLIFFQFW